MLLMPRIQRRHIERLKSNRSIRVYESERIDRVEKHPKPQYLERRQTRERRRVNREVKEERRRQDRRNAAKNLRPEIRAMLENAGDGNPGSRRRGGVYIDEDV